MNEQEAKAKLPNVKVEIGGKVHVGHVRGRMNRFATVFVKGYGSYEYSWSAIARAATNKSVLRV